MGPCTHVLPVLFLWESFCRGLAIHQVHIDLRKQCKVFDGIGAVSAGATSRLLVDYDEKERSDILDLLFKPGIGAELQLLKVEIGGDTFTGCGTEPSPQRSPHETSTPARGYELWLASEARLRSPAITILGLSWGFPAWIGAGALNENQVSYTEQWVQQAKEIHGIKIDWVGVVNESPWTPEYVKRLREALDAGGHGDTGIVASDNFGWSEQRIYEQLKDDNSFRQAVGAVGVHYPAGSSAYTALAQSWGRMWSSEDFSTNNDVIGAGCWARIINWNYVVGNYSSTLAWSLVSAWLDGLAWSGDGLMDANTPWSHSYTTQLPLWVTAHTTRFAKPGWKLLQHGKGAGFLPHGGSYVTYADPSGDQWTIVVEMMSFNRSLCIRSNPKPFIVASSQIVSFKVDPVQAGRWIRVFETDLSTSSNGQILHRKADLVVNDEGAFSAHIMQDSVVTFTTLQVKDSKPRADLASRRAGVPTFPLPYSDDFEHPNIVGLPRYFSDMCGSFAVRPGPDGSGLALRQEVFSSPSRNHTGWGDQDAAYPITIIGEYGLSNISVCEKFYVKHNSAFCNELFLIGLRVGGRLNAEGCGTDQESAKERRCVEAYARSWHNYGYFLRIYASGQWALLAGNRSLVSGTQQLQGGWHQVTLEAVGDQLSARVDDQLLTTTSDSTWSQGWAAIGSGWHEAFFDDFSLEQIPEAPLSIVV